MRVRRRTSLMRAWRFAPRLRSAKSSRAIAFSAVAMDVWVFEVGAAEAATCGWDIFGAAPRR